MRVSSFFWGKNELTPISPSGFDGTRGHSIRAVASKRFLTPLGMTPLGTVGITDEGE
jgi:hypothetical protein